MNKNTIRVTPKYPRSNYRERCFHLLLVSEVQKGWCANGWAV
nr:MAG TPA: hypothetical protein [Caudoviricetes sp.]